METFDLAVIGAGPGGYPAAIRAAQLGASVALVEREELGGACLNWGCIPSKTLIASAQLHTQLQDAKQFGLQLEQPALDYSTLIDRKNKTVEQLRNGIERLLRSNGVSLIRGEASFQNRNRLLVSPSDGSAAHSITAEKTIIAVGATSTTFSDLPVHERILDCRSFLELKTLPASVLILGGGVIGCEFACFLAQLGVQVFLVEISEDILQWIDRDVRREIRRHMEKSLQVRLLTGKKLREVKAKENAVHVVVDEEPLTIDLVLDATRRVPASSRLRLENAQLETDAEGQIQTDEYGQTRVATIYAIGDVSGGLRLAHAATSQGLTAAENACQRSQRRNETCVPCCIFTTPEIATVGLTEEEARRQDRKVKVGKFRFAALGKALSLGETAGFAKWIADPNTDQLLGAAVVGPKATELIAEATLAVRAELTAGELLRTIHAHPTLAEAWFESVGSLMGRPLHSVAVKS
jgi:dihydrolipoamide dehydrogenase